VEDAVSLGELPSATRAEEETTYLVALIVGLSVNAVVGGNQRESESASAILDRHIARLATAPQVSS
jgi:hypothetical protein